jgi:hypothetical protein
VEFERPVSPILGGAEWLGSKKLRIHNVLPIHITIACEGIEEQLFWRTSMGSEVIATCQCGLNTNIMLGGGMNNHLTINYFPCLCDRCHAVVQVNILGKSMQCPQCKTASVIPYDDPTLSVCREKPPIAKWEQLLRWLGIRKERPEQWKLTDGNFKCPQCGKMSLHFKDSGLLWD